MTDAIRASTPDDLFQMIEGSFHKLTTGQTATQPPLRLDERLFLECALLGTSYRPHEIAAVALAESRPDRTQITNVYATSELFYCSMSQDIRRDRLSKLGALMGDSEPLSLPNTLGAISFESLGGHDLRERPTQIVELGYEGTSQPTEPHLLLLYVRAVGSETGPVGSGNVADRPAL